MLDNKTPLVSIIVPAYKVEQYLVRCVRSIQGQKYLRWELILVDDGSPDNCPKMCDEFASLDDRIKVIHKQNGGLSSARNAALEIIKGDYVLFVDSDDYIHPDCIYDLVQIALNENADIVQHTFVRGASDEFPEIVKSTKIERFDNHSIFYSMRQKIIVWGKLYKRYIWDGIRMPEGKINEDDGTTWKLYYRSRKTVYVDTPYYYYRVNPTSIMSGQRKDLRLDFIEHYQERIAFFEKENDMLLTDLSKWRFCLPLMLDYMRGNVRKEDLPVLLEHFYQHNKAAIRCSKVHPEHRILIALFSLCPKLFRKVFEMMGKAHTL